MYQEIYHKYLGYEKTISPPIAYLNKLVRFGQSFYIKLRRDHRKNSYECSRL